MCEMSMGEEAYQDALIAEMMREQAIEYSLEHKEWRTADGRQILVSDMSDNHLKNSYRALEDGRILQDYCDEFMKMLESEMFKRGMK